jgi:hypothetical protein
MKAYQNKLQHEDVIFLDRSRLKPVMIQALWFNNILTT